MTHHLQRDPDVFHRPHGLLIVDVDHGYRTPKAKSEPHVRGWMTRRGR